MKPRPRHTSGATAPGRGAGAWAPAILGANTKASVALLNREGATRQAIASGTVTGRACTIDTEPVVVSPEAARADNDPIILSRN